MLDSSYFLIDGDDGVLRRKMMRTKVTCPSCNTFNTEGITRPNGAGSKCADYMEGDICIPGIGSKNAYYCTCMNPPFQWQQNNKTMVAALQAAGVDLDRSLDIGITHRNITLPNGKILLGRTTNDKMHYRMLLASKSVSTAEAVTTTEEVSTEAVTTEEVTTFITAANAMQMQEISADMKLLVKPEPDFLGPMNDEHEDIWDTWWNACQSSHKTYRLQGFKLRDGAGYFRHIRNGTQFRVEWSGEVPLHEAVHKACSRKCNKKKRKLGAISLPFSQPTPNKIDLDNLGEVTVYNDDLFDKNDAITIDLTGVPWKEMKSNGFGRYNIGRGMRVVHCFIISSTRLVLRETHTCKDLHIDQCSNCSGKRARSTCKQIKASYYMINDESTGHRWGNLCEKVRQSDTSGDALLSPLFVEPID
jgi:hypothetical protein